MKASPSVTIALAGVFGLIATFDAHAEKEQPPIPFSCGTNARGIAMTTLQQASPTAASKAADLAAAESAIAKAASLGRDALAGREVPSPYSGAAHWARLAASTTSPRTVELFSRTAKDQLLRFHFQAGWTRTHWAAGLSDAALVYAFQIVALEGCGVGEANTAWLKSELKSGGWFTIPEYGEEADQAAFLLVQHADRDPAFQAEVLQMLKKPAAEGKASPVSYAFLYDRVAVAEGRAQRYGTQGRCTGPGVWEAFDTEDPTGIDTRRATIDQPPTAQYAASMSRFCGPN